MDESSTRARLAFNVTSIRPFERPDGKRHTCDVRNANAKARHTPARSAYRARFIRRVAAQYSPNELIQHYLSR